MRYRTIFFGAIATIAMLSAGYYAYGVFKAKISQDKVLVAIATWPGFAMGEVAKEKGLFEKLNVSSRIIDDPTARLTAFRSGQVDIMISSLDVFAQESAGGIAGQILMVTDSSSGADGIIARADIETVNGLRGKSVGVAKGTPSHFFLYSLLKRHNVDLRDLKLVFFDDPTVAGQAFISGKLDAAVTWEPLLSQIVNNRQGRLLASSADTPNTIIDVLVGSSKFLANEGRASAFVVGWQKAIELAKKDPAVVAPIIVRTLSMPTPVSGENVLSGLVLADWALNKKLLCANSNGKSPAELILADAQQFWSREGAIPSFKMSPSQLINPLICR